MTLGAMKHEYTMLALALTLNRHINVLSSYLTKSFMFIKEWLGCLSAVFKIL